MAKVCCVNCFGNLGIAEEIASRAQARGDCMYCMSKGVGLIDPAELGNDFRSLLDSYEESSQGKPLVQWMRGDWDLFGAPGMDDAHAKELLGDILNDGEIVRKQFVPINQSTMAPVSRWEELRQELMHRNRFFPDVKIDLETLRGLLSALAEALKRIELPSRWYRARIQAEEKPFGIDEMGAPPPEKATHGRANPAGIPYLYVASNEETAISEVRPHTGEKVCTAEFTTPTNLKLIDLRYPRRSVSPFSLADYLPGDASPGQIRLEIAFLHRLGDELTRPVLPSVAAFEYTPSQYLCEVIKQAGYHGVIYRSSTAQGMNLALFDPKMAEPIAVRQHVVTKVHVEFESLGGGIRTVAS